MSRDVSPDLLETDRYPYREILTTRYADLDPNLHVNNVALAALFEDMRARVDWSPEFRAALGPRSGALVANALTYVAQVRWPDPLTMLFGITAIGRSSWSIASLAVQHDRVCAVSQAVMVCTNDDRSTALPQDCRQALEPFLLRPSSGNSA